MRIFKRKNPLKAIFRLDVDFTREYKENVGELEKGRYYYFPNQRKNEEQTSYEALKDLLVETIEDELPKHLSKTVGIKDFKVRVTGDYEGSIELIFTVLFNAYQFIAGMKDFSDNLRLIREHSRKFVEKKLEKKYGKIWDVSVDIDYPSIDRYPDELFYLMGKGRVNPFWGMNTESKRDGLFYYLLISNIILLIVIGLLVSKAVIKYYGW